MSHAAMQHVKFSDFFVIEKQWRDITFHFQSDQIHVSITNLHLDENVQISNTCPCIFAFQQFHNVCTNVLFSLQKELEINKDTSFKFCYPFPDEWGKAYAKAMVLAKFLVYYAIPLVIIGIFYIMIAIHLAFGASVPGEMQGAIRQVSCQCITPPKIPHPFFHLISHCA